MSDLFTVHILNDAGIARALELATRFELLCEWLDGVAVAGRELAIAKTHLETASFFAKKAIAVRSEYQKQG